MPHVTSDERQIVDELDLPTAPVTYILTAISIVGQGGMEGVPTTTFVALGTVAVVSGAVVTQQVSARLGIGVRPVASVGIRG